MSAVNVKYVLKHDNIPGFGGFNMTGVMKCSNCGKIVHFSDKQYELIKEIWKISNSIDRVTKDMEHVGISISFDMNILRAVSKTVKCCDSPFLVWSRDY